MTVSIMGMRSGEQYEKCKVGLKHGKVVILSGASSMMEELLEEGIPVDGKWLGSMDGEDFLNALPREFHSITGMAVFHEDEGESESDYEDDDDEDDDDEEEGEDE